MSEMLTRNPLWEADFAGVLLDDGVSESLLRCSSKLWLEIKMVLEYIRAL